MLQVFHSQSTLKKGLGILLLIFVAILATRFYTVSTVSVPLPFVQSWWDEGEINWNDPMYKRHRIADGLIISKSLLGQSRQEIETKLGTPPTTDYFSGWDLVYNLGAERGFISIDSEWLVIKLNSEGICTKVALVRD